MLELKDVINAIEEIKKTLGGIERDIYFDLSISEEIITNKDFENMNYTEVKSLAFSIIDDEVSKELDRLGA